MQVADYVFNFHTSCFDGTGWEKFDKALNEEHVVWYEAIYIGTVGNAAGDLEIHCVREYWWTVTVE